MRVKMRARVRARADLFEHDDFLEGLDLLRGKDEIVEAARRDNATMEVHHSETTTTRGHVGKDRWYHIAENNPSTSS